MTGIYFLADNLIDPSKVPQVEATNNTLTTILTVVFTSIGAIAFLLLVIAGFRYVISSGEPQKVAEIRRQIIYTAIGLILAAMADVIVTFVIGKAG
jgi:hypothetical protein